MLLLPRLLRLLLLRLLSPLFPFPVQLTSSLAPHTVTGMRGALHRVLVFLLSRPHPRPVSFHFQQLLAYVGLFILGGRILLKEEFLLRGFFVLVLLLLLRLLLRRRRRCRRGGLHGFRRQEVQRLPVALGNDCAGGPLGVGAHHARCHLEL